MNKILSVLCLLFSLSIKYGQSQNYLLLYPISYYMRMTRVELDLINSKRKEENLPLIKIDDQLMLIAQQEANRLAKLKRLELADYLILDDNYVGSSVNIYGNNQFNRICI